MAKKHGLRHSAPVPVTPTPEQKHVVIIGGGFGGLEAAKALSDVPVRITLIDRYNHHLFQPLLYQVAMAGLSPAEIAIPIRSVLSKQPNVNVLLANVTKVVPAARAIVLEDGELVAYDYLIVAAGAGTHYFGHPEWARYALGLKTVEDAVEIRRRVLLAFEHAEKEARFSSRIKHTTFVVIGAGPTGVELAGALAELSRRVLAQDFRQVRTDEARVLLLEGGPRVLPAFPASLSEAASLQLKACGVEVRTNTLVRDINAAGVQLDQEIIETELVLWCAGVTGNPLGQSLGVTLDRQGRVPVAADCSLPQNPEIFVVGDLARFEINSQPLPGVSPVAMQQARHVAAQIARDLGGQGRQPFVYLDKGMMATIGRSRAVAVTGPFQFTGVLAWLAWLFVHIWYLVGFKNRFFVFLQWIFAYVFYRRGARLITHSRDS